MISHCKTERLRRAYLPSWKLPRSALDHSISIDSGWPRRQERQTCAVLNGREPNVSSITTQRGLRRDEAQNCSVQTQLGNTPQHSVLVKFDGLLRVKDCNSIGRDQTRSSFATFTCGVHREGGDQEVRRIIVQQNVSVSCCTAKNCTEAELTLWTP